MHLRTFAALAALATVVLAACSGGASPAASGSPGSPGTDPTRPPSGVVNPDGLGGRTFVSTGVDGHTLVPDTAIRLSFEDGRLGIQAGCNSMGGTYDVGGDGTLTLGGLMTTEMACDPALMDQDQWIAAFLPGATVGVDGDTLTLARDGVTLTLLDTEVAEPDRPLEGTRWVVDGLVAGGAVSSVPAGVTASLTIADGRAAVEAGCNTGGADVAVTDTTITFGPMALTMMACEGPQADVERAVLTVLSGEVAYEISGDVLTLSTGALGLTLRAAS